MKYVAATLFWIAYRLGDLATWLDSSIQQDEHLADWVDCTHKNIETAHTDMSDPTEGILYCPYCGALIDTCSKAQFGVMNDANLSIEKHTGRRINVINQWHTWKAQ